MRLLLFCLLPLSWAQMGRLRDPSWPSHRRKVSQDAQDAPPDYVDLVKPEASDADLVNKNPESFLQGRHDTLMRELAVYLYNYLKGVKKPQAPVRSEDSLEDERDEFAGARKTVNLELIQHELFKGDPSDYDEGVLREAAGASGSSLGGLPEASRAHHLRTTTEDPVDHSLDAFKPPPPPLPPNPVKHVFPSTTTTARPPPPRVIDQFVVNTPPTAQILFSDTASNASRKMKRTAYRTDAVKYPLRRHTHMFRMKHSRSRRAAVQRRARRVESSSISRKTLPHSLRRHRMSAPVKRGYDIDNEISEPGYDSPESHSYDSTSPTTTSSNAYESSGSSSTASSVNSHGGSTSTPSLSGAISPPSYDSSQVTSSFESSSISSGSSTVSSFSSDSTSIGVDGSSSSASSSTSSYAVSSTTPQTTGFYRALVANAPGSPSRYPHLNNKYYSFSDPDFSGGENGGAGTSGSGNDGSYSSHAPSGPGSGGPLHSFFQMPESSTGSYDGDEESSTANSDYSSSPLPSESVDESPSVSYVPYPRRPFPDPESPLHKFFQMPYHPSMLRGYTEPPPEDGARERERERIRQLFPDPEPTTNPYNASDKPKCGPHGEGCGTWGPGSGNGPNRGGASSAAEVGSNDSGSLSSLDSSDAGSSDAFPSDASGSGLPGSPGSSASVFSPMSAKHSTVWSSLSSIPGFSSTDPKSTGASSSYVQPGSQSPGTGSSPAESLNDEDEGGAEEEVEEEEEGNETAPASNTAQPIQDVQVEVASGGYRKFSVKRRRLVKRKRRTNRNSQRRNALKKSSQRRS